VLALGFGAGKLSSVGMLLKNWKNGRTDAHRCHHQARHKRALCARSQLDVIQVTTHAGTHRLLLIGRENGVPGVLYLECKGSSLAGKRLQERMTWRSEVRVNA
jgi:hypothetical protein